MEQADILPPKLTAGPGYSLFYTLYLHSAAWLLRRIVAWLSPGTGSLFNRDVFIETPGLGEGRVKCSVCLPKNSSQAPRNTLPLVLVFEGGGFILGQPKDGEHNSRSISDELNAVVVSVDYAKSPRYPFPHALLQLYRVLHWCLSQDAATELGVDIDPARVAIMGNSAGGNLTASLSLLTAFTAGPCSKFRQGLPARFCQVAQVLLYPSVACNQLYRIRHANAGPAAQAKSLPIWMAELMEGCYLPPGVDKESIFVAPLLSDVSLLKALQPKLAPVACYTAGLDCLQGEAIHFCERLKEAGVPVETRDYPEAVHGFSHYKDGSKEYRKDDVEDCWASILGFLEKAFQK